MFSPAALPILSLGGALPDPALGISGEAPDSGAFAQLLARQPGADAGAMPSAISLLSTLPATGPANALPESGKILPATLPDALPGTATAIAAQLNLDVPANGGLDPKTGLLPAKITATAAFLARQFREAGEGDGEAIPADAAPKEMPTTAPAQLHLAMMAHGRLAKSRSTQGDDAAQAAQAPATPASDEDQAPAAIADEQVPAATPLFGFVPSTPTAAEVVPETSANGAESSAAPVALPVAEAPVQQAPVNQPKVATEQPADPAPIAVQLPPLAPAALTADSLPVITFEGEPEGEVATSTVTLVQHQASATQLPLTLAGMADNSASSFQSGEHGGRDSHGAASHRASLRTGDGTIASAAAAPTDLIAPDAPLLAAAPVVPAENGAPAAAPVTVPTQNERPADFTQIVDRLIAARDAAGVDGQVQPLRVSLQHAEFGKISLKFEQDRQGLSVSMTSADPAFAQAVQANTQVKAAQETSGDSMAGFANGQSSQRHQDAGSWQSGGFNPFNSPGQSSGQPGNRQSFAGLRDSASPAGNPSRDSESTGAESGPTQRRRGLFA